MIVEHLEKYDRMTADAECMLTYDDISYTDSICIARDNSCYQLIHEVNKYDIVEKKDVDNEINIEINSE